MGPAVGTGGPAAYQSHQRGDLVPKVEVEELEQEILVRDETVQVRLKVIRIELMRFI